MRLSRDLIILSFLFLGPLANHAPGQVIYTNTGGNTTGFITQYSFQGNGTLTSNGSNLVLSNGIWDTLPVTVTGNFQISYDVLNNSFDGDSHLLLLNLGTHGGLDVTNSPQGTDTPSLNIVSGTDFTNYSQYFFPTPAATLASTLSQKFPNKTWTHIIVTKTGNIVTDNVGGQILQTNVSGQGLASTLQIGLGGYATVYNGGVGQLLYSNIVVTAVPEPSSWNLATLAAAFFIGLSALARRKASLQNPVN